MFPDRTTQGIIEKTSFSTSRKNARCFPNPSLIHFVPREAPKTSPIRKSKSSISTLPFATLDPRSMFILNYGCPENADKPVLRPESPDSLGNPVTWQGVFEKTGGT